MTADYLEWRRQQDFLKWYPTVIHLIPDAASAWAGFCAAFDIQQTRIEAKDAAFWHEHEALQTALEIARA